ncbi:ankyrin repeat domain-containing protein [Obesumbacterium proteus]|nr:ankyrin repeat domain-containing protein [Obesumbacterium proteus]
MLLNKTIILFIIGITGCNTLNNIDKNYSLSAVANSPDDINKLKKIWFFCEKCLNDKFCENDDIRQCKNIAIPSRNEALSKAVGRVNSEAVHFLVDVAKTNVNETTGEYKETPLIIAAYYGTKEHQDIAEFLLSRGADINKTYAAVGSTPLGVAMWKHNIDFAKFLLRSGADPSTTTNGKKDGYACENAIRKSLPDLFPLIPGCCSLALHDLNFDPNITPEIIPQCQGVKIPSER